MSSLSWASFDIAFWLHHCNIDRLYESYVRYDDNPHQEFIANQKRRKRRGEKDLYNSPIEPFKKADGTTFKYEDTFDTKALGYEFSDVPKLLSTDNNLIAMPFLVQMDQVKITQFQGRILEIHVWLAEKGKENIWEEDFRACARYGLMYFII